MEEYRLNKLIITYQVNEFASSYQLKMSGQHVVYIDVESELKGREELLYAEIKRKLSEIRGLPVNVIKVTGMTAIRA